MSARATDLSGLGHGLTTERQLHINRMLQDYSGGKLTLRRIGERDPAYGQGDPPKHFGVWEESVARDQPNWVFTLAEMSIDDRVLARIIENDLSHGGVPAQMAKLEAMDRAGRASQLKREAERMAALEDEMLTIGKLAGKQSTVRHRINGEQVIIGDTIRPVRRFITR